jgi:two-component system chemotaxis response regulator CheB
LEFGPRAVGLLMSGVLDDGVLGAAAIQSRGGETVVQHPDDAMYSAMPLNALRAGVINHEVSAAKAGVLLSCLADRIIEERAMQQDADMELENRIAMAGRFSTGFDSEALGPPSGYTCPDCNGSLMTVAESNYRCRVGHAWTPESLLLARDDEVERALRIALRSLREKAKLSRRLADNVGQGMMAERYTELAEETEHAMTVLGRRLSEVSSIRGGHSDAGL